TLYTVGMLVTIEADDKRLQSVNRSISSAGNADAAAMNRNYPNVIGSHIIQIIVRISWRSVQTGAATVSIERNAIVVRVGCRSESRRQLGPLIRRNSLCCGRRVLIVSLPVEDEG